MKDRSGIAVANVGDLGVLLHVDNYSELCLSI